jgi:adenosylcobinamide kinase / adenosylcobinamide-phosphate guanylyltransferase
MLTLILGGARSGKSRYSQALVNKSRRVVYIATALITDDDEEMQTRILRHRADRPAEWVTVEEPYEVANAVKKSASFNTTLLIDCVTVWLSNLAWKYREMNDDARMQKILEKVSDLALVSQGHEVIAVSNEVGGGIVPDNRVARSFRDLHGSANQLLAAEAAHVIIVIAGLPLTLKDVRH